jgi:7-cyano-7-deazaguanine reductase
MTDLERSAPQDSPLGKTTLYPERYDAALLFPIERGLARTELGIAAPLPFIGVDYWTAYELSWLDARGKPQAAIAEFVVPADSPRLVESKSLKLYLNGFGATRMDSTEALASVISHDLEAAAGAPVTVQLRSVARGDSPAIVELDGDVIDAIEIPIDDYGPPNATYLICVDGTHDLADEALVSHLFKSNCPVTGQPDWASVQIHYHGVRIDRAGLLRYLVSYREHQGFHEQCVERIFRDIAARCSPEELSVYARYTRRGGIDINPFRATPGTPFPPSVRGARQ